MFTGIVEARGKFVSARSVGPGRRLRFSHPFGPGGISPGDSVAVDGACLTAVDPDAGGFEADLSPETLSRTLLGELSPGRAVNLERALLPTSRLGGHFVTGHVDGLGTLVQDRAEGGAWTMEFSVPAELSRYLAAKGSVAVDGVSLTVARVQGRNFSVAVIPATRAATGLGDLRVGARVHLEMDVLAKYVEAILGGGSPGLTEEFLRRNGF